ncbi:MAG TPA: SUMF1/EgtB/PvdO family nonheme iron enzyme, partial [Thermoanaerobaculia bacterium]
METLNPPDRQALVARYARNRERSERLFDAVRPEAYEARPIALRNPVCFYEGHIPAFAVNTLLKRGLGEPGLDSDFEVLFERGIDPVSEDAMPSAASLWPPRAAIRAYAAAADQAVLDALAHRDVVATGNAILGGGLAVGTVLEHEAMHQETLLYMWQRLAYDQKIRPLRLPAPSIGAEPPPRQAVRISAGVATLGAAPDEPFAWDNERPLHAAEVAAFSIDVHSVTNRDYLEFVEAGGYRDASLWDEEG